jgi:2-hydroxy-3-keto-5-methylthiopentenyl-1-phosphate phosphatase
MEEGKIEAFISDIISKFCVGETYGRSEFKRKDIVFVDEKDDSVFSEDLRNFIFDLFRKNFEILDEKNFFDLVNSLKVDHKKRRRGAFTIRAKSEIHRFLFSLWVEMITGIKIYLEDGNFKVKGSQTSGEFAFLLGVNYRFPLSSLPKVSTKNMVSALMSAVELICEGKFLVLDSLESLAVGLLLSYSSPKSKSMMILPKDTSEDFVSSERKLIISKCTRFILERINLKNDDIFDYRGKISFFCDFDGTITKKDVSIAVLDKFTNREWRNSVRTIVGGNIGSKDIYKLAKDKINGTLDDMKKFVRDFIDVEDGFLDFVDFLQENSVDIQILSDGFSFYIRELLKKYNLNINFYASELVYDEEKKTFDFLFQNESDFCSLCATCKLKVMKKNNNFFRVFVGNGISDRCAVEEAEIIFAKSRLKQICFIKGLDFFQFENFYDILKVLRKKLKGFIVDFDGTIGWSYEGILDAFRYTFSKFGTDMPDVIEKLIGLPLYECFKLTLGEDKAEKAVEIFRERYRKVFLKKTYLAPGVKETFELLKKLGYKIAILSNKKGDILRELILHFKIQDLVDLVLGEGDILDGNKVVLKPNPKVIDFTLESLGLKRDEVFVVGDSFVDSETAKNSNTDYIHLYRSDVEIEKLNSACGFISSISGLKKIAIFHTRLENTLK